MKKLFFLLIAATMFAASANAQDDPISVHRKQTGTDTANTLLTQFSAKSLYMPLKLTSGNVQTISAHNDTVKGKLLTIITAGRLDTVNLFSSNYSAGQVLQFLCTNAANDSTSIIPDVGNINGAAGYYFTDSTDAYKSLRLYYNGTDYFILK